MDLQDLDEGHDFERNMILLERAASAGMPIVPCSHQLDELFVVAMGWVLDSLQRADAATDTPSRLSKFALDRTAAFRNKSNNLEILAPITHSAPHNNHAGPKSCILAASRSDIRSQRTTLMMFDVT